MFLCTVDFFLGGGMNKSFLIENIRNTGEIEWKVVLGGYEELTKRGILLPGPSYLAGAW